RSSSARSRVSIPRTRISSAGVAPPHLFTSSAVCRVWPSMTSFICSSTAEGGAYRCTRMTPYTPCARTTLPNATQSSLEHFEDDTLASLRRGRGQDRAHGAGRATLLPDDLAQVLLRHGELEHGSVALVDFDHVDGVGIVDQGLGDVLDELLHRRLLGGGGGRL